MFGLADGLLDLAIVDANMLVQVSLLGESLLAVRVSALERPLARVSAQMVKEVVPFAEDHVAIGEVAFHNANSALRFLVLVVENAEVSCLGHVLTLNVNVVEVDVLTEVNLNIGVRKNPLEELDVVSLLQRVLLLAAVVLTFKG